MERIVNEWVSCGWGLILVLFLFYLLGFTWPMFKEVEHTFSLLSTSSSLGKYCGAKNFGHLLTCMSLSLENKILSHYYSRKEKNTALESECSKAA